MMKTTTVGGNLPDTSTTMTTPREDVFELARENLTIVQPLRFASHDPGTKLHVILFYSTFSKILHLDSTESHVFSEVPSNRTFFTYQDQFCLLVCLVVMVSC